MQELWIFFSNVENKKSERESGGGKILREVFFFDRRNLGLSRWSDGAGTASEKLLNDCRGSVLRSGKHSSLRSRGETHISE